MCFGVTFGGRNPLLVTPCHDLKERFMTDGCRYSVALCVQCSIHSFLALIPRTSIFVVGDFFASFMITSHKDSIHHNPADVPALFR